MRKITTLLAAVLMSSFAFAQNNITSIEIGSKVPMSDVKMKSTTKDAVSLDDIKTDKGLLVMFSCNTCPYVIKSQARTKEMMAYAKEKGIGMIVINSNEAKRDDDDSYKAMAKYAKAEGYNVPYAVDENSALANAFGATRTPEVFLFDANGVLMYKGAMEDNPAKPAESKEMFLKDAIDKMEAGVKPDPNSTKSIGCTIKRVS